MSRESLGITLYSDGVRKDPARRVDVNQSLSHVFHLLPTSPKPPPPPSRRRLVSCGGVVPSRLKKNVRAGYDGHIVFKRLEGRCVEECVTTTAIQCDMIIRFCRIISDWVSLITTTNTLSSTPTLLTIKYGG